MSITNGQWRIILTIAIPALVLAAAYGALRETVLEDIPALKEADKEQVEAIDANENAIITIEGKLETIRVQQKTYHEENSEHWKAILEAVQD